MFITLQLPFVDLRRFLRYPPKYVPNRPQELEPGITDFERIAKNEYVRCFGHYRLRSYIPKFRSDSKKHSPGDEQYQLLNLNDIWQDEYVYASTRRGLRFEFLEKQELLGGKLCNPRAKVRALRFFPFDPTHKLWTPSMRIETGILYDVPEPLEGNDLVNALGEFIKLKVNVPVYERDGVGRDAQVNRRLQPGPLIEQQKTLARLIVNGTTAQNVLRVHNNMINLGEPLLSVHYSEYEISGFPSNVISLPQALTRNVKISYHPLKNPQIGLWLFELPYFGMKRKTLAKKRETIRNNTIAIMRYWSEVQANIALRNAFATGSFEFSLNEMQNYVNDATKFLFSGNWHGAHLDIIRNIINAHQLASPERQPIINETLKDFKRQVAEKLMKIGTGYPGIFVSYSHIDKDFLSTIQAALTPLYKTAQIAYFDDTYIEAGEEWEQKIINSLENASVAVLLMSENFLESKYIKTIEQPKIIDRFQKGKLNIIPVLVHGEVPKQGFFSRLQFVNANNPLSGCTEQQTIEIIASMTKAILPFQQENQNSGLHNPNG